MSTPTELYQSMRAWEATGRVGDGPEAVRTAASETPKRYASALHARYPNPLLRPSFDAPKLVKGTAVAPRPHDVQVSKFGGKWRNYLDELETKIHPQGWRAPSLNTDNLFERAEAVAEALVDARAAKRRLRPVAAGHSASAVARPDEGGFLIYAEGLTGITAPPCARAGAAVGHLRTIGAGTRLRDLHEALARQDLSLLNLGGYDGQTLAGALFTGTHGSGLGIPALYGTVASIWLVTLDAAGKPVLRIVEPTAGITDPAAVATAAAAAKVKLGVRVDQRDDWFDAVVLGLGGFGMILAVTLRVQPLEWIAQTKELMSLAQAEARLDKDQAAVGRLEWVVSPQPCWQADGTWDHSCLVIRRTTVSKPAGARRLWPTTSLNSWLDDQMGEDAKTATWLARIVAGQTGIGPLVHTTLAGQQCQRFVSAMAQVLILPAGNHFRAKSCELFVPYAQTRAAVRHVLERSRAEAAKGRWFNAPMGVRFCAATRGWLSPTDRGDAKPSTSIEIPILVPSDPSHPRAHDVDAMLQGMIDGLAEAPFSARPHWGQFHQLSKASVARYYTAPQLAAVRAARQEFDPTGLFGSGVFDVLGL